MARKILIVDAGGKRPVLSEVPTANELELQRLLRDTPDLLPADELGVTGPLLVVGRETVLPSGAVDLVAVGRGGDLLIVELKTGPQNPDFRAALAQAIDYGADVWGMSLEEFESSVAVRYFKGAHCDDPAIRGKSSLSEAARAVWPDLGEEELETIHEQLGRQLTAGSFLLVVAAQRFTPPMLRTIDYLNEQSNGVRFAAVELVVFEAGELRAFESRAAARPSRQGRSTGGLSSTSRRVFIDEARFLDRIPGEHYRDALSDLFAFCRGLQLRLEWGSVGVSIRVPTSSTSQPLTVAWVFPPGIAGWMGLHDLTLGFDMKLLRLRPSVKRAAEVYMEAVSGIPGATQVTVKDVFGRRLQPSVVQANLHTVKDAIAGFVGSVNEDAEPTAIPEPPDLT